MSVGIVLRDRIVAFLMAKRGRPFCNDCISAKTSAAVDDVRLETETMKVHKRVEVERPRLRTEHGGYLERAAGWWQGFVVIRPRLEMLAAEQG